MNTIQIPYPVPRPILALGADLKCRPALASGDQVTLFDEIGDLASPDHQAALEELADRQTVSRLVCDRHPGYFSTELAHRLALEKGLALQEVQHHRAHVAAVCLERGLLEETVVGLAFDGTGYGDDGRVWGGEFLVGSVVAGFERKAHFAGLPLPGGDAAVREPWRMALALLLEAGGDSALLGRWLARHQIPLRDLPLFQKALASGFATGRSTALGRWFDAVSALLGICPVASFEAEPAIKLQQLAEIFSGDSPPQGWHLSIQAGDPLVIEFPDPRWLAETPPEEVPRLAASFHLAATAAVAEVARTLAEAAGTRRVIASGGCFLNGLLDRWLARHLAAAGLEYLKPQRLPPGDQAIALGQIALAFSHWPD